MNKIFIRLIKLTESKSTLYFQEEYKKVLQSKMGPHDSNTFVKNS